MIKKILTILDHQRPAFVVAERAARIARGSGASLELFCAVHEPEHAFDLFHLGGASHEKVISRVGAGLDQIASSLKAANVTTRAAWGHPFDDVVLAEIEASKPDLVVMGLRKAHRPTRKEWHIIRGCKPDLLVVKGQSWAEKPEVMACVDPSHAHDKPAELDRQIVQSCAALAAAVAGPLNVFHALGMVVFDPNDDVPAHLVRQRRETDRHDAIDAMLDGQEAAVWLAHAESPEAIMQYARQRHQGVCAIGSLSRTPLNEYLLGGALRELVPKLDCDLLLIHPPALRNADV